MIIKMTKGELLRFYEGLISVGGLKGSKFAYAVAKNSFTINDEIEALRKAIEPAENFVKFDKERVLIAEKYAVKNDKGQAETYMDSNKKAQFFIQDKEEFEKAIDELKEKHKEAIKEREVQVSIFDEMLKEEISFDIIQIAEKELPADITPNQLVEILIML